MGIKANAGANKNNIFKKAMSMLNPRSTLRGTKKKFINGLENQIKDRDEALKVLANATDDTKYNAKAFKKYISEDDFNNADKRQEVMEILNGEATASKEYLKNIQEGKGYNGMSFGDGMKLTGKGVLDYYNPFNKDTTMGGKALRYGVTAGAYAAGATGIRLASGGSLTKNNENKKDIAGIPFI